MGTPQKDTITLPLTPYQMGKWPYELPYPDFLAKKKQELVKLADNDTFFYGLSVTKDKGTQSAIPPNASTASSKEEEEEAQTEEVETEEVEVETDEEKHDTVLHEEVPQNATSTFSFIRDWKLPQGLRSFHSKIFLDHEYPVRKLNPFHQSTVDRLFDPQQQCKVTFKEFKGLWEYIGGKIISNNGGSHQQLIGPLGESLGGIFTTGNNQTYGKNFVIYLQTYILYVGPRPTTGL